MDVNGVLLCQKKTDVYGISRGNVGTALSRHGFVGGLGHYSDDETGLVYMRARYYDPNIGRFTSEDPAAQGKNWFVYCGDNPVNRVDASGKSYADILITSVYGAAEAADDLRLVAMGGAALLGVLLIIQCYIALENGALDGIFYAKGDIGRNTRSNPVTSNVVANRQFRNACSGLGCSKDEEDRLRRRLEGDDDPELSGFQKLQAQLQEWLNEMRGD